MIKRGQLVRIKKGSYRGAIGVIEDIQVDRDGSALFAVSFVDGRRGAFVWGDIEGVPTVVGGRDNRLELERMAA